MKFRSLVLAALVLALGAPLLAQAQGPTGAGLGGLGTRSSAPQKKAVEPKKAAAIRKLIVTMKADELGDAVVDAMRQVVPGTDEFWEGWKKEFFATFTDELVHIYDRHLDMEEIQALTKFYESDVGKRLIAKQRTIAMDSAAVGQELGMQALQRLMQKMQEGGANGSVE